MRDEGAWCRAAFAALAEPKRSRDPRPMVKGSHTSVAPSSRRPKRIALIQPWVADSGGSQWTIDSMISYLAVAADLGAELAVFPEAFPFWLGETVPDIDMARTELARVACPAALAFIAGGYVRDQWGVRNALFLTFGREPRGTYFKRELWRAEKKLTPPVSVIAGEAAAVWTWGDRACIPLICADVYSPSERRRRVLIDSVRDRGGEDGDLIVVSSYGGVTHGARWQSNLAAWAREFRSPVAFCNFAGVDRRTEPPHPLGRGGSRVVLPSTGLVVQRRHEAGIFVHDV